MTTRNIFQLPNELMFAIVQLLDIVDAFQLSCTCRHLFWAIHNYRTCRTLIETQAPFSPECQEVRQAHQYMRAFRLLAQRKIAIANLEPFAAAVVAVADSYLYVNGTLLYMNQRTLHILSLRGAIRQELVIDIRSLLDEAIEESQGTDKYKFRLLHYAQGIVTCRYSHCRTRQKTWLVVFHAHERWARSVYVDSPRKIFARNNQDYVVYGAYTGQGDDGLRRWVLRCFSVRTKQQVGKSFYLRKMIGGDIGFDICFNIFDDYFYALSNQTAAYFNPNDDDSYYSCYRIRLAHIHEALDIEADALQEATTASRWRRSNFEGTIDDRWTFLRLEKDERTGAIQAVEARKEWRLGSSTNRRSYYSQVLEFSATEAKADTTTTGYESDHVDSTVYMQDSLQLSSLLHRRLPDQVHIGDDSDDMLPLRPNDCFVRSYYTTSSTFLDLLHIPSATRPGLRRLCLRAGTRRRNKEPWPMLCGADTDAGKDDDERIYPIREIRRLYDTIQPQTWPRAAESLAERLTEEASEQGQLETIMNPPDYDGDVSGVWDDRSLLYAVDKKITKPDEQLPCTLVFVSFDPSIRFGLQRVGQKEGMSTTSTGPLPIKWMTTVDARVSLYWSRI